MSQAATAPKNKNVGLPVKEAQRRAVMRIQNGRIVSLTLSDPVVKRNLDSLGNQRRKDLEKLREEYIKAGLLTPTGRLTRRYGG